MGYQVLARKYRPQRFADVAGQDHVTVTLMNALTQNRIAHGYIFSGHRGIGKTTIARILACALNCRNSIGSEIRPSAEPCEVCDSCLEIRAGNSVDVIEIDAATNRGIDEIRELRDAARYRPSRDRFKIYLLDEAHQITDAAFNALLKTLEEPPDHIVFMMATTQPEDIPQTVRSRCQHFSFHAVKLADILGELRGIAGHEGVDADEAALALLAEAGDGSMRDALSIMDQAIASAPLIDGKSRLDAGQIRELMGTVPNAVFERVMQAVDQGSSAEVMTVANDLLDAGNSPAQLARQAVRYLRSCVIAKISGLSAEGSDATELLQISAEEQRRAARTAALFSEEELTRFMQTMLRTFDEMGYRQEQRFHFELGLLKLVHLRRLLPVEEVLSALGARPGVAAPARSSAGPVSVPKRVAPQGKQGEQVEQVEQAPQGAQVARQAPAPARPAFSPFEQDKNRRKYDGIQGGAPVSMQGGISSGANALAASPAPMPHPQPVLEPFSQQAPVVVADVPARVAALVSPSAAEPVATPIAIASARTAAAPVAARDAQDAHAEPVAVPELVPEPGVVPQIVSSTRGADAEELAAGGASDDASALQSAVVEALRAAKQGSAADAMEDAVFTRVNGEARIQMLVSKTMLPHVINPDAERITKAALRTVEVMKFVLLPGAGAGAAASAAAKKPRAGKSGSAQAKAMEHPMVKQAQKLFDAEIQTVIDLSGKD